MLSWFSKHSHTIVSVIAVTGTVLVTTAAATSHILPASVGAWLAAAGSIIVTVLGHVVVPPVATKLNTRFNPYPYQPPQVQPWSKVGDGRGGEPDGK
jgi:hypothetical protein